MTENPRSARQAKTLAGRYYTSPQVFALESERIFDRHWLCVARESELSEPGDYSLVEVEGENLILVRGNDGELRCFYNVCRHRGTQLCETSAGRMAKTFRCPYHGWTYDLSGKLLAAPNMAGVTDFDASACGLNAVPVANWGGFVFVNFGGASRFDEQFAPVSERLERWEPADLVSVERRSYTVEANWKLLFQNYNECYHCPCIHPALNALSSYATATNDVEEGPFLGGPMELSSGVDSMTTTGARCAAPLPGLEAADQRRVYYYSLFPTLLLSPHPDFVLVHRIERVATDVSRVVCEFLFHTDAVEQPGFDATPAVEFWDQTNRQDWRVCELSQRGVSSRGYQPGFYADLESTVAAFDRHYLTTLGEAGE